MKKILVSPWTALITLVIVLGVRFVDPSFVESVRLRYFDTLITAKETTQNNIVTVNIDESSLEKYGQWPLPRTVYSDIIKELYQKNAGLVVLNILMPEPDRSGGDRALAATLSVSKLNAGSSFSSTVTISGMRRLTPSISGKVLVIPIPAAEFSNNGIFAISPGYCII